MAKSHTRTKGLTLVELMVTLATAGILVALATPTFTGSLQNNRLSIQINDFHTSLSVARTEAIKRNVSISVCQSDNGSSCMGNWQDGWIIFVDNDNDGTADSGEEILRVHGAISGSNSLTFSQANITYAGNGIASSGLNGTFTFCDTRGAENAKALIIGVSGRPRLATDSNSNGILEDANDVDLVCS